MRAPAGHRRLLVRCMLVAMVFTIASIQFANGAAVNQPDIDAQHSRYVAHATRPPLRKAWQIEVATAPISFVTIGDILCVLGVGRQGGSLIAVSARSGNVVWTRPSTADYLDRYAISVVGGLIGLADRGVVRILRPADGKEVATLRPPGVDRIYSMTTLHSGDLILSTAAGKDVPFMQINLRSPGSPISRVVDLGPWDPYGAHSGHFHLRGLSTTEFGSDGTLWLVSDGDFAASRVTQFIALAVR